MGLFDYYLHSQDEVALQQLAEVFNSPGECFDYIGRIPDTYDADRCPVSYQPGYFANLRLSRPLEGGELSGYLIAAPETPFRVWAE
ncbi:hypothetical protein [Cupriavidus basilensis]|uniref:hypothetical protein n=1 Tax=Cupriavidus basilensis TaxID=68895 RepID=UPI0020A6556E|nr:hypothetical protein [Cupriavidus basilensis]MCP3023253.1 hypothetical protein [Cupriavidus basilensis]